MKILMGFTCSMIIIYILVNLFVQFSEITFVNLFRIKQFVAYAIGLCFCIMPFVVKLEEDVWVFAIFAGVFAIYFFIESYIARDDFFAWLEVYEEQDDIANEGNDKE